MFTLQSRIVCRSVKFIKSLSTATMSNPIVQVQQGQLKGKISKTVNNNIDFLTFKGIPYAKPPVGDLRFSMPVDAEPWEGTKDATKDCNICAQYDNTTQSVIGDEDCLYLNVFTPKLPTDGSLMPVMVFLHGGGFLFGHGTDDSAHGGDYLVEKNVVVVSINYRVGILGFLSLDRKDAAGNMGLKDQVQALKWVQKNINKFGGDPDNVTIFGFSAGGASVEYLVLSPLAKGLFHKAIAQSGSTLLPWAQSSKIKDLAYQIPSKNGKNVTSDEEVLDYLKNMPIKELIMNGMEAVTLKRESWRGGIYFGFVPTVEKPGDWEPFLDKKPYDVLSSGEFTKVPFMSGFSSREGLLMLFYSSEKLEKLSKEKKFMDFLPFNIDEGETINMENKLKAAYLEGAQKFDDEDSHAIDFFSDVDFIGGGYVSASLIAKRNAPVYFYEFAYDGALNYLKKKLKINRRGACHGDDGGYIIKSDILLGENMTQTDHLVQKRMLEMWTNFAKLGDPTPQVTELVPIKWEPVSETGFTYLHIDQDIEMRDSLYPARTKLFKELYEKYDLNV